MSQITRVVAGGATLSFAPATTAPESGELAGLAQLAFASRTREPFESAGARHLAFLSPEALDMDLSDPIQRDFGDYELIEKIGQGGMGIVYRARQHSLDREVALKLLAAGPWASNDFIERFRREAQSAARMEHPNIVTVYETGSQQDLQYFSMRLIRSESLAARLQRERRLPPRDAARLLLVVASALDYAHRLGVLHLDLKPGNVLIDERDEPMVADFGLARRIDEALSNEGDDVSGTPSYMAPEQALANSQTIGRATDIYGLGSILYEMLTGQPPFLAPTAHETLKRVVLEPVVEPREYDRSIPADLEAICLKCLAKNPDRRYVTAAALADDLRRWLEDRPVSVRQAGVSERALKWIRREPRVAAALGAFALALSTGLAISTQQWQRAEKSGQQSRELLWEGRREAALRLEQDGKGYEALPRLIDNLREQEMAGASDAAEREKQRIGLLVGQGATLIDRIVIDDANPLALALSPDGSILAVALNDLSVRWYDSATLTERGRVSLDENLSSTGDKRAPVLLRFAGQHRLRVTLEWNSNLVSPNDNNTWLVDLQRAAIVTPPDAFAEFADATYSADGLTALLRNQRTQSQLWQVEPWQPQSPVSQPTGDVRSQLLAPDASMAASVGALSAMRRLFVTALPNLQQQQVVALPGDTSMSAWAFNDQASVLALGDVEGGVSLLDTDTGTLRRLPTGRGREVTWLAFSEDNAWLASASADGLVYAFDVATGESLAGGLMRHDFALRKVGISRTQRLVVATGDGQSAIWRLAQPGPRAVAAQRIGAGPAPHALAASFSTAWSFSNGLFASAGIDGQVRLWRLPDSATLAARAAPQYSDRLDFDGRHLPDTEWDHARLIDIASVRPNLWKSLGQPPGFAELLDEGRVLLTSQGPQLHFDSAATGVQRLPPLDLPNSPQRLLLSPNHAQAMLSFGTFSDAGFVEQLRLIDVGSGTFLPGELSLAGPIRHFSYSKNGEQILAVGPVEGSTSVFSSKDLSLLAEYPHDSFQPVQWASFDSASDELLLVTRAADPRLGDDALLSWDSKHDTITREVSAGLARPLGVIAIKAGSFVAGSRQDMLVDARGSVRLFAHLAQSEPTALLALSANGRLLARGFRREVQLYAADTAEALGPPLQTDINAIDLLTQLAFSPDGSQLIARSQLGYWLRWTVASEKRGVEQLDSHVRTLRSDNENQRLLYPPTAKERKMLRQSDPGPWPEKTTRPLPTASLLTYERDPVPSRSPNTPASVVDLDPIYDTAPDTVRNPFFSILPALRPLPRGVQRFDGVNFDLRGAAQIGFGHRNGVYSEDRRAGRVDCLPLPASQAPAIRLLLSISTPQAVATGTVMSWVSLHYVDGSRVRLPLRAGIEVPGYAGEDARVPFVFATHHGLASLGLEDDPLKAPRLINPHPNRPLRCVDIDTIDGKHWVMLLLGISMESPLPDHAPAAVIAPRQSGSSL